MSISGVNSEYIEPILYKLRETGCKIYIDRDIIFLEKNNRIKAIDSIKTMPYPGFPTDAQSVFAAALTTAKGTSLLLKIYSKIDINMLMS